jgi:hypothetical protein
VCAVTHLALKVEITRSQANCEGARRCANTYTRGRVSSSRVSRCQRVSKYITRGGSLCYHQRKAWEAIFGNGRGHGDGNEPRGDGLGKRKAKLGKGIKD